MRNVVAVRRMLPAFALALIVGACSSGGSANPSGSAGSTSEETNMAAFVLSSPSFTEGGPIPSRHTCDGQDISPALSWEGAPAGTAAFVLIVDDPDAVGGFIHWLVYDMAGGASGSLPEGVAAAGPPPQGRSDFGRPGWGGPCPPGGTHHYQFTLYALSARLGLSGAPSAAAVRSAMEGKILAQTRLVGTYKRGG
jgi:Raf kinase inhibitor-like YbhB/YbcL family protein